MTITLEKLGTGIGNLCAIFNPEKIVVGGGVSQVPFYQAIRKAVRMQGRPHLVKDVAIVRNKLGGSSGVLGAASLVLRA
jgi:glucokinase